VSLCFCIDIFAGGIWDSSEFFHYTRSIEYLHEHHIIHRDIKPDNLLLSANQELKIVDFGVSEIFRSSDCVANSAGSPAFIAPELCRMSTFKSPQSKSDVNLKNNHIKEHDSGKSTMVANDNSHFDREKTRSASSICTSGRAADIWSMGVTLYCLVFGRLPFVGHSVVDLFRAICEDEPAFTPRNDNNSQLLGSEIKQGSIDQVVDLLKLMLEKDPKERITLDGIRDHPWVTNDHQLPLECKSHNLALVVNTEDITVEDLAHAISKVSPVWSVVRVAAHLKTLATSATHKSRRKSIEEPT
jgi:serine/threonine protein kinase